MLLLMLLSQIRDPFKEITCLFIYLFILVAIFIRNLFIMILYLF